MSARRAADRSKSDAKTALARHGFHLEEVSHAAGINFVHQSPTLDPKLEHIMPQVASMGAAVSVVDFDRDGWPGPLRHQQRRRSRTPLPQPGRRHVQRRGRRAGRRRRQPGRHGRLDGRGLGRLRQRRLRGSVPLQVGTPGAVPQRRRQGFTRVTEQAGLPRWVNANTAIWLDYDRDGLLDLFSAATTPRRRPLASARPRR